MHSVFRAWLKLMRLPVGAAEALCQYEARSYET